MAGPAIRAWRIAEALSREHEVRLVTTLSCDLSPVGFECQSVDPSEFAKAVGWEEIVIFQVNLMALSPALQSSEAILVADIYDPFHLEALEQTRELGVDDRLHICHSSTQVINQQLSRSDYFLCASAKQRDFWLGQLAGVGRINPATYDASENLDSILAIVPFGVDGGVPIKTRSVMRGVIPGIGSDDLILLWGGGIYNWFDPLTLLRAVEIAVKEIPAIRLFFLGMKHPNPHVGEMKMAVDARSLAKELGLTGKYVFFNEDWVPYEERGSYLVESDLAVSTHLDHIETEFSFRTRLLDCFWASLPIVATSGDSLANDIEMFSAGRTVPPGDAVALAAAIVELGSDANIRAKAAKASGDLAEVYRWSRVLEPVLDFCRNPRTAPDRANAVILKTISNPVVPLPPRVPVFTRSRNAARLIIRGDWGLLKRRFRQHLGKK